MQKLQQRTAEETYSRHLATPPRVYLSDAVQHVRIKTARHAVIQLLRRLNPNSPVHHRRRIVELGCGMADISGWFSWGHDVTGFESSPHILPLVGKRFPWMEILPGDIQTLDPVDCDVLILCEILEHLADPVDLCRRWLPHARCCLISSPIEEHKIDTSKLDLRDPLTKEKMSDISGGEHVWSFEESDLRGFMEKNGHSVVDSGQFQMGLLTVWMGCSELTAQDSASNQSERG